MDSGVIHRLPFFPKNTRCVGSTDDWLALDDCTDEAAHAYSLHNPFTGATVPLLELDSLIGKVPGVFEVRKVLMRSTPDDLVAVTCNIWRCPLILCRPGKGAWVPRLSAMPYFRIIDAAFIGDKLYAITKAEEDADGKPTVSTVKRIIMHAPGHSDDMYNDGVWTGATDIDASSDEDNDDEDSEEELDDDEALDEQEANHDDVQSQVESAGDGMQRRNQEMDTGGAGD